MTDTEKPLTVRAWFYHNGAWGIALARWRATDNDPRDDMLDCPVDTHVGQQCLRLKLFIDRIEALGAEPDDVATMRHAAIRTMAVWYFG